MRTRFGLAYVILVAACGGQGDTATDATAPISRDLFVQTYVELRMESFDNTPRVITDAEKDVILAERGITDEDLRHFIQVHGSDLPFMRDLWADIEAQILSLLSPGSDSTVVPDSGA
jgi:hypothetical protein